MDSLKCFQDKVVLFHPKWQRLAETKETPKLWSILDTG